MNNIYTEPTIAELFREGQNPIISERKDFDSILFWSGLAIGASVVLIIAICIYEKEHDAIQK